MKPLIITFGNNKGGDGKTTSAIQIAHILTTVHQLKGLFVDLDGQANATKHLLGVEVPPEEGIAQLFSNPERDPKTVLKGLDKYWGEMILLPGNQDLNQTDRDTMGTLQREYMLKEILEPLYRYVDFIIIDTPPAKDIRLINALAVSKYYLVPTKTSEYSLGGIQSINALAEMLKKKKINPDLELLGVLCCQYDKGMSNAYKDVIARIKEEVPGKYLGEVYHTIKFEEAIKKKISLQTLDGDNRAAVAYRRVAQIISERI